MPDSLSKSSRDWISIQIDFLNRAMLPFKCSFCKQGKVATSRSGQQVTGPCKIASNSVMLFPFPVILPQKSRKQSKDKYTVHTCSLCHLVTNWQRGECRIYHQEGGPDSSRQSPLLPHTSPRTTFQRRCRLNKINSVEVSNQDKWPSQKNVISAAKIRF